MLFTRVNTLPWLLCLLAHANIYLGPFNHEIVYEALKCILEPFNSTLLSFFLASLCPCFLPSFIYSNFLIWWHHCNKRCGNKSGTVIVADISLVYFETTDGCWTVVTEGRFHQYYLTWRTQLYYAFNAVRRCLRSKWIPWLRVHGPFREPRVVSSLPLYLMDTAGVKPYPTDIRKSFKKEALDTFNRWLIGVIWSWGERPIERSWGNHKRASEAVDLPGSTENFLFLFLRGQRKWRGRKGWQKHQQKAKGRTDRSRKR